jgi:TP901 family phage tail tape measure protein
MPLQVEVIQTGLEASIVAAAKKAGRNLNINLGTNTRSISALSQPLGRITGQADEFTKSMEAANARVFAFGASVGIINGVTKAFGALVRNTIEVEKSLVEINTVLNASSDSLQQFGNKLFDVAKTTGQTFDIVAKGALELARQGLSTEETLKRINDALILSRLSGLDAQQSVEGLTAAFNSFQETGITTSQILNKLVVVSQKYSVSERDLIEGLKRSASVADQAGVSFDELVGIITTVQERTARGGAVIGNAFKTIFARIQDRGALEDLRSFGIEIQDVQGKILPATQILQNLAGEFNKLTQVEQADLAKKLGGVYQLSNLLAAVKDLSSEQSKYVDIVKLSAGATDEAYKKNAALNETLATLINKVTLSAQQLGATLGEIGIADGLKKVLDFVNYIFEGFQKILGEESALGTLFKGLAKGIGSVLAGPGLAIFAAIIGKLSIQLAGFGVEALKSFFKINSTSKELQNIQGAITSTLLNNKQIQQQILSLEGNRVAQAQFISIALNEQLKTMQRMQSIAASITPAVYAATSGARKSASKNVAGAAGGYMPAVAGEASDIRRGVGGARAGDKPVVIPNFAFGGGKKGTMVAHTGEYIVPNFAGGGSAIFNRDMVRSMGLPSGAKKIGAAGGFIPNFAEWYDSSTKKVVTSTDYPKTPGNWTKIASNSQTYRKYADTLENYKLPNVDFYLFPDGTGGRGATVRGALGRNKSRAVEKAEEEQEKISAAGEFKISANDLGGIAVVSPRFGSGVRELSVTGRIGDYAIFNREDENSKIDKNRFITLSGIKGVNTPKPQDVKGLSVDINRLFADRVVDLAYKLYGGTFDSASAGEFGQKLKSLGDKQSLLPPTAEGQIFEAAGKVALNSIQNLESLFGSGEENRPFDFQNPKAIQQMFGINVLRGDAKRGGESGFVSKEGKMATSKNNKGQDMIRKSLNDPEYSAKMLNILKAQGAFSPEMQRQKKEKEISNAVSGFIPNFVNQKYVMDTLARIKAGTSGFSKQEQETFLNKFGAKSTGKKISLREVYDKLDGDIGISTLIDKAYMAAGPTASNEDVYKVFEKQIKANPYALRSLVSKKGFIPNFADPLKEAIGREMSAGIPVSQIYVDQNSSLKNPMNPMGLMVANRRDEPAGGMQGISRARKEGANPMLYGAAGGFVPNYAPIPAMPTMGSAGNSSVANKFNAALNKATLELQNGSTTINQVIAELGKIRPTATRLTANAQALAQKYSEELLQRQQAVATRILESNAGRKLAAQLDKIYIEYNKSQKTKADLTAAEKKAAEVLQKTSLSQSSQRAIVSSTGSLAGSRLTAQPQATGDLLTKMFGLQTALSLLTGATSDTENAFATAANAITSVASSFTSVYLVFEGLKGQGGKLGSLFGAFGGKLGIYAAGAYALYEGWQILAKNLDSTNGSINNATYAMEGFAKAASGATVNFGTLSESQKKRIQTSREGLIEGGRRFLDYQGSVGFAGRTKAVNVATFEGYSDELETQFEGAIDQALAVGVSYDVMFNRINAAAKSANKITAEEVENMINEFKTLAEEIAKVKPTDFLKNSGLFEGGENEKYFKELQKLSSEELDTQLGLFKEKGTKSKEGGVPFLQELIEKYTTIDNLTAQKEFAKIALQAQKEAVKAQEESIKTATESASLSLLKQQLENRIAYKKALFEASSAEEYSLELQKEMLSVSEKDRTLADYKLQSLQAAKKLTSEQADATIGILKDSELIQKKLQAAGVADKIDPQKFKQLTSGAEEVGDAILKQGGYTDEVKTKLQALLTPLNLTAEQQKLIRDTVQETNDQLSKQATLQNKLNAQSNIQKATLEASNFVYEKRSESVTREYDRLSKSAEQRKRNLDLELEAFKVQKEREKIGGGAGGNLSIDRQIFEKEEYTINAKLKIDQEDLLNQLRKTLSESAMKVGFTPEDALAVTSGTASKGDFEEIATIIEEAEKEAKIQKIEAALQETQMRTNLLNYEVTATQAAADYFYRTIADSGVVLKSSILGDVKIPDATTPNMDSPEAQALKTAKEEFNKQRYAAEDNANEQIEAVRNLSKNFTGLFDTIGDTFVGVDQTGQEAANSIGNLKNALLSAGASLTTFANLVRGVFTSLPESISQNKFAMLTATDTQSIIGNAVEARRNDILSQGPASAGTIAQAADATAIYEKELEIKKAITAADKINGEFELQKLKEILPLRLELLKAETNSEREAIIDRIIAKEKQRLPLLQRIKAEFSSTAEERAQRMEDSLVDASVQFRDNLIDGISQAVEQGGSLGDVLRSAALDFARAMTRAGLQNVAGQIGGLFGFNSGGMVPRLAGGGMINGGSGTKDDIPAMLTGGEFVVNKKSVQKYGPDFLHAINSGKLGGYAKGGKVEELPMQSGGEFYTPGTYGQGGIQGRENLLAFAKQGYTSGQYDVMQSGENYASVNLEAESLRLTNFGRRTGPQAEAVRSAKQQAFGLYEQEIRQEEEWKKQVEEAEKQAKAQRKAMLIQIGLAVASSVAGSMGNAGASGAKAGWAANAGKGFTTQLGGAAKGFFTGAQIGGVGPNVGGLGNWFTGVGKGLTGNFTEAGNYFKLSQIGDAQGLAKAYSSSLGAGGKGSSFSQFLDNSGYTPTAINLNPSVGSNGIFNWFKPTLSGATGEDIKDPSQWVRGGASTAYDSPVPMESIPIEKDSGVQANYLRPLNKRYATGGIIPSTSGIDTVPAMLSGGEFIMNRAASQNIGTGNLQALNAGAGSLPTEEKTEELNDKLVAKLDELIEVMTEGGGASGSITINVDSNGQSTEETSGESSESKQKLAKQIKDTVIKVIEQEKRLGGKLRRGL